MAKFKIVLLSLYITLVLYLVLVAGNDHRTIHFFAFEKPINLVPFKEKIRMVTQHYFIYTNDYIYFTKEIVGNLLLLFPLPFFLVLNKAKIRFGRVVLLCLCVSMTIELVQLFSGIGSADIDDIILNTFGGYLGTLLASWIKKKRIVRNYELL